MSNSSNSQDFSEVWQEIYEELCVLRCQVCGLSPHYLEDELQFDLHVQVTRLFKLHDRVFEMMKWLNQ